MIDTRAVSAARQSSAWRSLRRQCTFGVIDLIHSVSVICKVYYVLRSPENQEKAKEEAGKLGFIFVGRNTDLAETKIEPFSSDKL